MKTLNRVFISLLLLLGLASPVLAQTATTQTTLSTAITANTNTMTVASATGIAAGTQLVFMDAIEAVTVGSISGTTVTLSQRGIDGTATASHSTGAIIFASAQPSSSQASPFIHGSPTRNPLGSTCIRANQPLLPLIDVDSGNIWDCTSDIQGASTINGNKSNLGTNAAANAVARWKGTQLVSYDQMVLPRVAVINADYQIKPWDYLIAVVSASGGGHNLTLPSATGLLGKQIVIVDEGGFLANATAFTVVGTINGAANLPLNSAYTSIRVYSTGIDWIKIW